VRGAVEQRGRHHDREGEHDAYEDVHQLEGVAHRPLGQAAATKPVTGS
jgi:hypothetical protein